MSEQKTLSDQEIFLALKRVYKGDAPMTKWEANFLGSMMNLLDAGLIFLTPPQRKIAGGILEKHAA